MADLTKEDSPDRGIFIQEAESDTDSLDSSSEEEKIIEVEQIDEKRQKLKLKKKVERMKTKMIPKGVDKDEFLLDQWQN